MLARRNFLALLGFGAGAATAVALKFKPARPPKPPIRYVGTYHNVPIYEHDNLITMPASILERWAVADLQAEINERRSAALFYAGEQWTPEQIANMERRS